MPIVTLENAHIRLAVSTLGAEMQSLKLLPQDLEVLWQGHKDVWPRRAPWLFPIVGKLFSDSYSLNDKAYSLKQHGFARDSEFEIATTKQDAVTFRLKSNDKTLTSYPFLFSLEIQYSLVEANLRVQIRVSNKGPKPLPFSFGAHPGFISSPHGVIKTSNIEENYWQFEDGQTPEHNQPLPCPSQIFKLKQDIKDQRAIVFKKSQSKSLEYIHPSFKLNLDFKDWPHFALWSKSQNHFICLEPWCGLPQILEGQSSPPPSAFEYLIEKDWERELVFRFSPMLKP